MLLVVLRVVVVIIGSIGTGSDSCSEALLAAVTVAVAVAAVVYM